MDKISYTGPLIEVYCFRSRCWIGRNILYSPFNRSLLFQEQMLDWTKYPHGPKAPTPGWVEESFTNFDKVNIIV